MRYCKIFLFIFLIGKTFTAAAQPASEKGNLFIIGGGDRPPELMKAMVTTAKLNGSDYVIVLPMSSEEPDTSYFYFKADLAPVCSNPIINFNFTKENVSKKSWLDSLEKAKLIFITGGDQDRFMNVVANSPVYNAIHTAYKNGATIAGTSAGAAVMSKEMITGNALTDTTYRATFRALINNNIEIKPGLGLLNHAIIDQHFIVRSRYNRLLSALAKYPTYTCIGIDEATAIIVHNNKVTIAGMGQVIVMQQPKDLKVISGNLIKMKDIQFSIYTAGDIFLLNK